MKRISIAILMTFVVAPLARAQECTPLREMVVAAMPATVGNQQFLARLLTPPVDEQLSDRFDPKAAEKHVRDQVMPEECCTPFRRGDADWSCRQTSRDGSLLNTELGRGRVIYLNRERSGAASPASIPRSAALALGRRTAAAFGVPPGEIAPAELVKYVRVSSGDVDGRMKKSYVAEAHVFFKREVGGIPVAWSRFHTAIDAKGEVARVHVRWPDLRIAGGVGPADVLSRDEVARSIVDTLETNLPCGTVERLDARVAYVATKHILGGDSGDGDEADSSLPAVQLPPDPDIEYLPALLVTIYPFEQREDSGEVQEPIEEIAFPLFRTSEEAAAR